MWQMELAHSLMETTSLMMYSPTAYAGDPGKLKAYFESEVLRIQGVWVYV